MTDTYTIKLPQFEGPFDLLLFFIERDELDIYNIPIASITNDFLSYVRHLETMDIDLASEFILVAATLCRIKAKMLLPRRLIDEAGNEIDPREELVQRLLEYKRYKSIFDEMQALEEDRALKNQRGNLTKELHQLATKALVDVELESLTLFKLLQTFEKVMLQFEDSEKKIKVHEIIQYPYTITEQKEFIFSRIAHGQKANFVGIFGLSENKIHAIVTFLALLELLNLQEIRIIQGEGMNNFWLSAVEDDQS